MGIPPFICINSEHVYILYYIDMYEQELYIYIFISTHASRNAFQLYSSFMSRSDSHCSSIVILVVDLRFTTISIWEIQASWSRNLQTGKCDFLCRLEVSGQNTSWFLSISYTAKTSLYEESAV